VGKGRPNKNVSGEEKLKGKKTWIYGAIKGYN